MMINGLDNGKPYELQCVSQTLALFDVLSKAGEMPTLSQLSRSVGISRNKMFRLLATLEQHGIVEKSGEGWYRFGDMAFVLARRIIVSESIMDHARPIMTELAGRLGESVYLATNKEDGVALLQDMVACRQPVRTASFIGAAFPLPCQGGALALAKSNPVKYPGVSVDVGGLDSEVTTVSALVRDSRNSTCGALVVLAPTFRTSTERIRSEIAPALVLAAARLSGKLAAAPAGGAGPHGVSIPGQINNSAEEPGYRQPGNYTQNGIYYQQQV